MTKHLTYISTDQINEHRTNLTIGFTDGGLKQVFKTGPSSDIRETIHILRRIAEALERKLDEEHQPPETEWKPDYSHFPFHDLSIQDIAVLAKESRALGDEVFVKACMNHLKTRKPEKESP